MHDSRIILGIDPGTNILGFGVISVDSKGPHYVTMGVFDLRRISDPFEKLANINAGVKELIAEYSPTDLAVESPFYGKNAQVILKLGRAQGAAIIAANRDWRDGDQLSLVVATQKVTSTSLRSIPTVKVDKYEVILGSSSSLISTVIPADLLSTSNGKISMASALVNQGAAFVHSRTVKGETYVSTAFMVANNAETISGYNTTPALLATANTYGGYRDGDFLESTSETSHTAGPGQGQADPSNPGGQGGGSTETFAFKVESSVGGSVLVTRVDNGATIPSEATVAAGTKLRLTANPSSGYAFNKWNDNDLSNPRIVTVNADATYRASFVLNAGGGDDDEDIG